MEWVDATVAEVVQETPIDRSFVLALPAEQHDEFAFEPGQYLALRDPADGAERDWYFSLSGAPSDEGFLRITVRGRGDPVQPIYEAPVGTTWRLQPPAGSFRFRAGDAEHVVLIGAGSGVTPFRALVEHRSLEGDERPVSLLQCARLPEELLFHKEFMAWSDVWDALTYVPTVTGDTADWNGRRGRIDEAILRTALGDVRQVRIYACGPNPFVDEVLALAAALGVDEARCHRQ